MKRKAQALLIILFIMVLAGTLMIGLSVMWQADIKTLSLEKDGIGAFYLAQAGLERAKTELKGDWNWSGVGPVSLGGGNYTVVVGPPVVVNSRSVTSYGRKGGCLRTIGATIGKTISTPVNYTQTNWREL